MIFRDLAVVYEIVGERPKTTTVLGCAQNKSSPSPLSSRYQGCGHSFQRQKCTLSMMSRNYNVASPPLFIPEALVLIFIDFQKYIAKQKAISKNFNCGKAFTRS